MTTTAPSDLASGGARLRLPSGIRACLFDLDGVLTDTASVHFEAWKETFDAFLRERARRERTTFEPFESRDYEEYVDGRERFDGVGSFLASRGIEVPAGNHDDPPDAGTIGGLGNRKNQRALELIRRHGVKPYEGSARLLAAARSAGLRCAVVSASANCREVLQAAGIEDMFEARVDGIVAEREHLRGKPAPDTYLAAARLLGVPPREAAVFEDALAGVGAGRAGGFGLVVGVDRVGHASALRDRGADIVVSDLGELVVAG
jgi:beta-phosphoglucomutase family hydrolase